MKNLIFNGALNNLSFGNVSVNMLRELYKKQINTTVFPIGDKVDLSAFDKLTPDFQEWLQSSINSRLLTIKKDTPALKMWHIQHGEQRLSSRNFLYTFYELDCPTPEEKNLVDLYDKAIFSSTDSKNRFEMFGCQNVTSIPIGFDPDFHKTNKKYMDNIHFVLMGKFEKRKHTAKILNLWAKKYGNNPKYQLTACITNPFLKGDQMQGLIANALQGKRYFNINFLPFLKTNSEVNELLNSADIDLTGLSGAEGWNLPAFNSTCLGKWSIVLNCSSHKDWATKENSILLEPSGKESAVDGMFFSAGTPFNQGNIYTFKEDELIAKFEEAEKLAKTPNPEGEKLKDIFTYENTLNKILGLIDNE
jgi:hypothetical protein